MSQNKEHLDLVAATLTAGALPQFLDKTTMEHYQREIPLSVDPAVSKVQAFASATQVLFSCIREKLEDAQKKA